MTARDRMVRDLAASMGATVERASEALDELILDALADRRR